MTTHKFEVYTSLKPGLNGTEAFLLTDRAISISYNELIEAICLYKHKIDLDGSKCIGCKISNEKIVLLFDK